MPYIPVFFEIMIRTNVKMGDDYLFVYGTLLKGFKHPVQMFFAEQAKYVDKGSIRGQLFCLGGYPGVIPSANPGDKVYGEAYLIKDDDRVWSVLDEYEGCGAGDEYPQEYRREKVEVTLETGKKITAWTYLYNLDISGYRQIESGRFRDAGNEE
ncbi:MAG: gamma-glutamylcyclotransferase family protein [Peptococcaceae bacterium]